MKKYEMHNLKMPCPRCGEPEARIEVNLWALDGNAEDECFRCVECEEFFNVSWLADIINRWPAVLAWLEKMPSQPADDGGEGDKAG
jgi:hypothetical protein